MYLASRGCDVTMLDLSGAGFEVAQANFAREGLGSPSFVKADARRTNLPAASFDCVFSIGLLEHFEDPKPVLAETLRLLRPGGFHFALIVPDRPPSVRYLSHALFCPWVLAYELMPQKLRAALRKLRNRPASAKKDLVRTGFGRDEYLKMLEDLDVTDARCIPYNPYHPVYNNASLESLIAIPLYRFHRAVKKLCASHPLATAAWLASCELLTFRKRG
jgi:ubiquinone/menaquinone biosynthesis C-methylase UbiE